MVLVGLLALVGNMFGVGPFSLFYLAEGREIKRLASQIQGVESVEFGGNRDVTFQDIWLDLRYRGERVYFEQVTPNSFERWTAHLGVGAIGPWSLDLYEYPPATREAAGNWDRASGKVSFGPEGPLADRFDRPFDGITDFLKRIDEAKAVVAEIPLEWPGLRIAQSNGRIIHIRRGGPPVRPFEPEAGAPALTTAK